MNATNSISNSDFLHDGSMPRLISVRTLAADQGTAYNWHSHDFEELSLVTDDCCLIGNPLGFREATAGTLLHYHRGEQHGAWASSRQRPRFCVIHFDGGTGLYRTLRCLGAADVSRRMWMLKPEQAESFRWVFLQLLNEHRRSCDDSGMAASAWLQLLLLTIERWCAHSGQRTIDIPGAAKQEVMELWQLINDAVGTPHGELESVYASSNYDSVRHAFREAFGMSPRKMLHYLRGVQAKNLLLETTLSIKEIAARVGYPKPYAFSRMFFRLSGTTPSEWRANPLRWTSQPNGHQLPEKREFSRI